MKGLLDRRGRGSWGRVEGVVDQGRGALEPGEIAAIVLGVLRGPVQERAGLPGDGETWRLAGERRAAVQGPILE